MMTITHMSHHNGDNDTNLLVNDVEFKILVNSLKKHVCEQFDRDYDWKKLLPLPPILKFSTKRKATTKITKLLEFLIDVCN